MTLGTFTGNISNAGVIAAGHTGVFVGGEASAGAVTLETFGGGIVNTGTISAGTIPVFSSVASSRERPARWSRCRPSPAKSSTAVGWS